MSDRSTYRDSHVGQGFGEYYDGLISGKYDGVVWERFVRPFLGGALESERSGGKSKYLDFACGTGRITVEGTRVFRDATGVDISSDMMEVARQRAPSCRYILADITTDPEAVDGMFDCITSFRFFLNAEPALREQAMAWLSAHAAPGAALIGNIHMNPYSPSGVATVVANRLLRKPVNYMSRRSMEALLSRHGFTVEYWRGFRFMPTFKGRALLPGDLQANVDAWMGKRAFLQKLGSDQVFVARRR